MIASVRSVLARLRSHTSGVAAVEYAMTAPIVLTLFLSGAELTNYTIAKLRVSQIALHVADNASRIGTASLLTNPQITETQINDLLIGANLQAGSLDLRNRGKVILSSFEAVANPNTTHKFKIHWQRCFGSKVYSSPYGSQGTTNLDYIGPANRQVTAPDDAAIMYVEVAYNYKPLISARLVPTTTMKDVAAMIVRDDRDYNGNGGVGLYNPDNVTVSNCST